MGKNEPKEKGDDRGQIWLVGIANNDLGLFRLNSQVAKLTMPL